MLGKTIKDQRFIRLIEHGLKSNVLLPDGTIEKTIAGTPQGGVCSPLLSNIVLHELDKFMLRLKYIIDRGPVYASKRHARRPNKTYMKIADRLRAARKKGDIDNVRILGKEARKVGYGDPLDSQFRKLAYVRYADDFLIGIIGPIALAKKVKNLISKFLEVKLKLKLNLSKTVITRAKGNKVPFLGFLIHRSPKRAYTYTRKYFSRVRKVYAFRGGSINLLADTTKVIRNLALKGFCDKSGFPKPNFYYFQDPQSYTVSRVSALLYGLANYYNIADSKRAFINRCSYIIRHSLAMMFAAKFKLQTQSKVFAKAGRDLSRMLQAKKGFTPIGNTDEKVIE